MAEDQVPAEETPEKTSEDYAANVQIVTEAIIARIKNFKKGLSEEIQRCRVLSDPIDAAKCFDTTVVALDDIKEEMKELNATFEHLATEVYPHMLMARGVKNVPLGSHTIGMSTKTMVSVRAGQKEDAIAYMRADVNAVDALNDGNYEAAVQHLVEGHRLKLAKDVAEAAESGKAIDVEPVISQIEQTTQGLDAIVVDHIFPQTLTATGKELAEKGVALPEEIFTTYQKITTTRRKAQKK